ncbi:M20/M25/M40 family metallo-hydrolase [Pedobacter sp. HMF7647]|uniref:Carboxypeptidase Q n=1 Tax=Hufsiella arboris TaxID=2695275 RepID=A0A7K1YCT1_9SPHI|nr:M20/M25/M40 family metallo-hydrolase [Hufsiella arboris]MXV52384.1 M20/M25/M40 family metallo-hydrolase [Hufsiella arboris]
MKRNLLLTTMLGVYLSAGFAQTESFDAAAIQKIRDEGLKNSKVMQTAFYLTDVSGPRLSGSPGLKNAQEWAAGQLKALGLQNVKLEPWGKFGKGWQVDKYYAAMTAPYYHALIASPKAWTPGTNGPVKSEVVLLIADSVAQLDQYKGKLAGKIVIFDSKTLTTATNFNADARRLADSDLVKMENAAPQQAGQRRNFADSPQFREMMKMRTMRQQISAFLTDEKVGCILTLARGNDGTFFTSNGASYAEDAKPVAPELEMSGEDYLRLLRLVKGGIKVQMEVDTKTSFYDQDLNGYNVIGEIPGTDKKLKNEVVMIGAHFDSWHAATGATDNAAGSAVMMEAIRIIKAVGLKPKRTIRIALWSSEEQGLFGSKGYVTEHLGDAKTMVLKPEQQTISAYYNLDNGTGKIRGVYMQGNPQVKPIFQSWLQPFNDLGAKTLTINNTGGTDHLSFDAVGVPGFQFIQDGIDYGTRTHHSNQDTYDRLIEDDLKQAATIVAAFAYNTAQRADKLPRKELPKAVSDSK